MNLHDQVDLVVVVVDEVEEAIAVEDTVVAGEADMVVAAEAIVVDMVVIVIIHINCFYYKQHFVLA